MASSNWQQFLTQQGYSINDDNLMVHEAMPQKGQSCLYDLSPLGALLCAGEDATDFLQGQLSNDINQLAKTGDMQLSAYCTPKGRMLALFNVIKNANGGYFLIAPQAVIDKVKSRLQMFVMRAKVNFTEDKNRIILGIALNETDSLQITPLFKDSLVATVPNTQLRSIAILNEEDAIKIGKALPASCALSDYHHWQALDILDGLPQLNIELVEELIPQSINLDLVGGVNFKKGCYPGQEIIARIKYRGKPKTRMLTASIASSAAPQVGDSIFIDGKAQSAGLVINTGAPQCGETAVLITTPVSALNQGNHYLSSAEGEKFNRVAQAYPVPL